MKTPICTLNLGLYYMSVLQTRCNCNAHKPPVPVFNVLSITHRIGLTTDNLSTYI